jgi:hypothetical protein
VRDTRTAVKQSRFRYYRVEFNCGDQKTMVYAVIDSNGNTRRYASGTGATFYPPERCESRVLDGGKFLLTLWGNKVDWRDVFNGDLAKGRWGITNPSR